MENTTLKLKEEHALLLKEIATKFNITFEEAGDLMLEKGFIFMRILAEPDEKILACCKLHQENTEMKNIIDWLYEMWKAGQNPPMN